MRAGLRWLSVAGLVLGLVGATAVSAAAVPPVPGLARHTASGVGTNFPLSVTVFCPSPHVVYGVGGAITGGNGQVHMVSLLPNAALTAVTVTAVPRTTPLAPWNLDAHAICGRKIPGHHLEAGAAASWTDTEGCNGGTVLFGTGARQTGGVNFTLRQMAPNSPAAPPVASTASTNPQAGAPGVTAAAICADPIPGLQSVDAAFAVASTVACPAGKLVHGTGGLVFGANPGIVLEGIVPNLALTQVRVTARNGGGVAQPTKAYAICS